MSAAAFVGKIRRTIPTTTVGTKQSLRDLVRDSKKVRVARYVSLLNVGVGDLMRAEENYLLGLKSTTDQKAAAEEALVNIAYPLAAINSLLKTKLPSENKKVKVDGTHMLALLRINSITQRLMASLDSVLFGKPPMEMVEKNVRNPKDGTVSKALVTTVDRKANTLAWEKVYAELASVIVEFNTSYYGICFSLTGKVPKFLFEKRAETLPTEFPTIDFTPKVKEVVDQTATPAVV